MTELIKPRNQAEVLRDEMFMRDRVLEALRPGPQTIAQVAETLGYPSAEVVKWVMALRRYGLVEELPKPRAEDYYEYKLVEKGEEVC